MAIVTTRIMYKSLPLSTWSILKHMRTHEAMITHAQVWPKPTVTSIMSRTTRKGSLPAYPFTSGGGERGARGVKITARFRRYCVEVGGRRAVRSTHQRCIPPG